jgi:3-mercaptopyruvate sulfurtransferase SseA
LHNFLNSYNRGAIPGSINITYSTAFSTNDGSLVSSPETGILNANRGKIICAVGNRGDSAVKVCFFKIVVSFFVV